MLTLLEEVVLNPLPQIGLLDARYSTTWKHLPLREKNGWNSLIIELIILSLVNWTVGVEGEHIWEWRDEVAKGLEAGLFWHPVGLS